MSNACITSSSEKVRIAEIIYKHVNRMIDELGSRYTVSFDGKFGELPIKIEIKENSKSISIRKLC